MTNHVFCFSFFHDLHHAELSWKASIILNEGVGGWVGGFWVTRGSSRRSHNGLPEALQTGLGSGTGQRIMTQNIC